jgi:hypothetical protein
MILLARLALSWMICPSRRSEALAWVDSSRSWAAWLMEASGLRISWAMLAVSRPRAASLIC